MRLTEKEITEMFDNLAKYYSTEKPLEAIEKLGQLEDIEEELGIDLITLSKLFKAQKIYTYGHIGIQECSNDGVSIYDKSITIYNGVCVREYPLSEYGKSFALTREELL